jgi:hypothetical protein
VLLTAPGGLVDQFPKDMMNLGRAIGRLVTPKSRGSGSKVAANPASASASAAPGSQERVT